MSFVLFVVLVALAFDFINGFHDAANSIATVVGTRVLTPKKAVAWAAFFNFVAAFSLETRVAKTIGKDIVNPAVVDPILIFAALVGAIVWNLATWWWGLPSSSSHALIGGFAGAAMVKAGPGALVPHGIGKTVVFIVLSPLLGFVLGFIFFLAAAWIFRNARPEPLDRGFRKVQLVSAAAFSFGHGMNDAQKTMGIIAVLLFSTGHLKTLEIPFWIVLICHAAIGLGTLTGGVAHRTHDGNAHHGAEADRRLVRRVRGSGDAHRRVARGHPGVDDAHDHGRDHGNGLRSAVLGRALGRRALDRDRVDPDDTGVRRRVGGGVAGAVGFPALTFSSSAAAAAAFRALR